MNTSNVFKFENMGALGLREFQKRVRVGKSIKPTGIAMTTGGVAVLGASILMLASADEYYYNVSVGSGGSSSDGDLLGGIGSALLPISAGLITTGIIIWIKGGNDNRRIRNRINNDSVFVKNKINDFWNLNIGLIKPTGKDINSVFSKGIRLNTGLNFGLKKIQRIKFGPSIGLNYFYKSAQGMNLLGTVINSKRKKEKQTQYLIGASIGYLLPIPFSNKLKIFIKGTASLATIKNKIDPYIIFKGSSPAFELSTDIKFKLLTFGLGYTYLKPTVTYSQDYINEVEKYNYLYDLKKVSKTEYVFNLSSINFKVGVLL